MCFLCMICLHVIHMLFRLSVFVVTHDNVYSKLYIYLVKLGSSYCLLGNLCYDRRWRKNREKNYDNFAGTENDLNLVLSTFVDSEHEISNFCHSRYVDLSEVQSIFQNNPNEFLILTLNIQSVNAKFNNLFPVIDNLASQGLYFGAICLQETWTSTDSDLSLLQLPGYQLIHQGSKCTKHGGLMIYLNESYSYKIRNSFTNSNIWEGLFIDINGGNLCRTFTIGNIYRPPHDNNNNANIQQFISELSPIIDIIQRKNTNAAIVGDFNINLLQISEREKFCDFSTWCVQIIYFLQ